MGFLRVGRISEMKANKLLRRGLGIATAAVAMLVVAATPASAGENTGTVYAKNGDGWARFVSDGDHFYLNDTKVDGDAVWMEISWYKSGHGGWHYRTIKSTDNGQNTEASKTTFTWDMPEGAYVYLRACGSVKADSYSNVGDGKEGVAYDCGDSKDGVA
jgi:hypothetical protein